MARRTEADQRREVATATTGGRQSEAGEQSPKEPTYDSTRNKPRLALTLTPDAHRQAHEMADAVGGSVSQLVERLVRAEYARIQHEKPRSKKK
jgi:hypothetical protein